MGFRIRRFMGRCTEITLVVLVVLVFFAVFTALLFRFFPSGISLTQILERGEVVTPGGERKILGIGEESEPAAAELSEATNEVKSRHSRSIAWGEARTGMSLFDRDAVQTLERSTAQIRFDSRNHVNLGSNTLVIIKKMARNRASQEKRAAWVIADGELSGRLASARLEISTPTAQARLNTAAAGLGSTDFRLSVNPDQSSSLAVYGGEAQVSARGETVTVRENRGVTVRQGEAPRVVELLPPPEGMHPAGGESVPFRDRPPRVEFSWLPPAGTSAFHLQLAVDQGFKTILLDRRIGESRFIHGNLKQGVYYWRVASIRDGLVGKAGRPLRLEVKQSLAPPPLTVSFPAGDVKGERFLLRGKTSPGCTVFVGGKEVRTDGEGAFSCEVVIRPGMNLVTVEAFDGAGNAAYQSHYAQGRF
jgi:hypothetical protein